MDFNARNVTSLALAQKPKPKKMTVIEILPIDANGHNYSANLYPDNGERSFANIYVHTFRKSPQSENYLWGQRNGETIMVIDGESIEMGIDEILAKLIKNESVEIEVSD